METIYGQLQRAQQEKERHQQNGARFASQYVTYETTGFGDLIPAEVVPFPIPFLSEPAVLHGAALIRPPSRTFFYLPQVTGMVYRWERNRRGFYTGAFLCFRVDCELRPGVDPFEVPAAANPIIYHHFTFTGPSYKKMSREVNSAVMGEDVPPIRPPGMST